jgi:hypothetical protein
MAQEMRREGASTDEQTSERQTEPALAAAIETRPGSGESLDKIRDILFGSQSREYERRFTRLEERLIKESADLRDDLRKRFDSLETYIKKEVESLADRLRVEHGERSDAVDQLARDLKETGRNLEKKNEQLSEHLNRSERDLRDQLLGQSKALADDILLKHEAMSTALEREARQLRDEKTDRTALAGLFMEVALRLNNEFKIPGAEGSGDA